MIELDPVVAAFAAVLFHILLWLARSRWRPMFVLASIFLFLSFLSRAQSLPLAGSLHWLRLYMVLLILVLALFSRERVWRFGRLAWAMLLPIGFYAFAAGWSMQPVNASLNKGLVLVVLVAGMVTARSTASREPFARELHPLLFGFAAICAAVVWYLLSFRVVLRQGRLRPFEMNPNVFGMAMSTAVLLCAAVALNSRRRSWRLAAVALAAVAVPLLVLTGSRSGVGAVVIGGAFLALPAVRRPKTFLAVVFAAGIALITTSALIEDRRSVERLGTTPFKGRLVLWEEDLRLVAEAPVFGRGWIATQRQSGRFATRNAHSIYLQVLVESGGVGLVALLCGAALVTAWGWQVRERGSATTVYAAFALLYAVLARGVGMSVALLASMDTFLLGFAVGLLDRERIRSLAPGRSPRPVRAAAERPPRVKAWSNVVDGTSPEEFEEVREVGARPVPGVISRSRTDAERPRRPGPQVRWAADQVRARLPMPAQLDEATLRELTAVARGLSPLLDGLEGQRLLDMGGPTARTGVLAELGFACSAVDYLDDLGRRDPGERAEFERYAAEAGIGFRIPLPPDSFDVVAALAVLERLHYSPRELLNAMGEHLRPGGLLVIATTNAVSSRKRLAVAAGRSGQPSAEALFHCDGVWRGHVREYTVGEVRYLCEQAGFELVRCTTFERTDAAPGLFESVVGLLIPGLRSGILAIARKPEWWAPAQADRAALEPLSPGGP